MKAGSAGGAACGTKLPAQVTFIPGVEVRNVSLSSSRGTEGSASCQFGIPCFLQEIIGENPINFPVVAELVLGLKAKQALQQVYFLS